MEDFNGLITFYSSHFALKAENLLKKNGMNCLLIPGPKELSPNCGVALQFEYEYKLQITELFNGNKVIFENIYEYNIKKKI